MTCRLAPACSAAPTLSPKPYRWEGAGRRWPAWLWATLAWAVLIAGVAGLPSSACAQVGQPTAPPAEDDAPWPVLDDGRVVFTIYSTKLAMPTCPACLGYYFYAPRYNEEIRVRDAIAHPERLRRMEAASQRVFLKMWNGLGRDDEEKLPFLGRFDARTLPRTPLLYLILSRQPSARPCWEGPHQIDCLGLHDLDVNGRDPVRVLLGMNYIHGPYVDADPALPRVNLAYAQSLILQKGDTLYLAPPERKRDAIGLPIRFLCHSMLNFCSNSTDTVATGYALTPSAQLLYTFQPPFHPPEDWLPLHDRMVEAVGTLLMP